MAILTNFVIRNIPLTKFKQFFKYRFGEIFNVKHLLSGIDNKKVSKEASKQENKQANK